MFLSHLHADHTGDLAGLLLYPWGVRVRPDGPAPPVHVWGSGRPAQVPAGDADFRRWTTICPELPAPGTSDLVGHILARSDGDGGRWPDPGRGDPGQRHRGTGRAQMPPRPASTSSRPA